MLLFLVGYMGSGKTSLGRKLAKRLGWAFVDTDERVEAEEGATVSDIFKYAGEAYFRKAERRVLDELIAAGGDVVISTGGGLPTWGDNMERMNEAGRTIYVERTAEHIAGRLTPYGRRKRPALQGLGDDELAEYIGAGIESRRPFYNRATVTIAAAPPQSDEQIINTMAKWTAGQ